MVKIKGLRVRTQKITFSIVDARVEQKFRGIKIESEKIIDPKINGHIDRCYLWTP